MGSQYKNTILEEHTIHAIKQWHTDAKQKRTVEGNSRSGIQDGSSTNMTTSPVVSSHKRTSTLAEFASRYRGEITEQVENEHKDNREYQNQELWQNELDFSLRV